MGSVARQAGLSGSRPPPPFHAWLLTSFSTRAAPLHAEAAAANSEVYYDPTTATPFPQHLSAPDGTALRLVGTGVRTVSFLNIRVYAAGFYVSQRELDQLYAGKLGPDWTGFTPERLIPPFASGGTEQQQPKGEVLMESLLEKADTAVIISAFINSSPRNDLTGHGNSPAPSSSPPPQHFARSPPRRLLPRPRRAHEGPARIKRVHRFDERGEPIPRPPPLRLGAVLTLHLCGAKGDRSCFGRLQELLPASEPRQGYASRAVLFGPEPRRHLPAPRESPFPRPPCSDLINPHCEHALTRVLFRATGRKDPLAASPRHPARRRPRARTHGLVLLRLGRPLARASRQRRDGPREAAGKPDGAGDGRGAGGVTGVSQYAIIVVPREARTGSRENVRLQGDSVRQRLAGKEASGRIRLSVRG